MLSEMRMTKNQQTLCQSMYSKYVLAEFPSEQLLPVHCDSPIPKQYITRSGPNFLSAFFERPNTALIPTIIKSNPDSQPSGS
jgi:hypothetical protein